MGTVTARIGDRVAADAELFDVTSTTQVVDISIKLSGQKFVIADIAVTIKLPGAKKTARKTTFVGTLTKKSSGSGSGVGSGSGSGESKERAIPITVTLTDASATANLQEVSVTIDLPNERRINILSAPVGALLALGTDQYGIEVVEVGGTTCKVPVTVELFVGRRMEVSGQGISEGQRMMVS